MAVELVAQRDGTEVARGDLDVPEFPPLQTRAVTLPAAIGVAAADATGSGEAAAGDSELHLTVSAALAGPRSWAESGHVVARAQFALQRAAPQRRLSAGAVSVRPGGFEVAAGDFDVRGRLTRLGGIPVLSAGLSVWRARLRTTGRRTSMRINRWSIGGERRGWIVSSSGLGRSWCSPPRALESGSR